MKLIKISILISAAFLLILGLTFSSANARVVDDKAEPDSFSQIGLEYGESAASPSVVPVCSVDTPDMIGYWPMDDGASATTFEDYIAGHNGSCTDPYCPVSAPGIVDTAFAFDGVDDGIDVLDFTAINWANTDSFSIEAWVKIPATGTCVDNKVAVGRYGINSSSVSWWLGCDETANQAAFSLRDNSGDPSTRVVGTTVLNDGNWHHLVAVRVGNPDGSGDNTLYVDGNQEATASVTYTASFATDRTLNFGYMDVTPYYHIPGSVDEIAIYDRALTLDEIQNHYNDGDGQSYCANPPVITDPGDQISTIGDVVSLPIVATDPDSDALTYGASGLPDNLAIDTGTGVIAGTVALDAYTSSPYSVTVTVEDDSAPPLSDSVSFEWIVSPGNAPPVLVNPGPQENAEGDSVSLQVTASDSDEGDTLTYGASELPDGLAIGAATGLISGTISYDASASSPYTTTLTVTDDGVPQLTDVVTFTWTVTNTNRLPEVVNPGAQFSLPGDSVSLQISASDPDGEDLTYAATGLPDALGIDPATGLISGTVTTGSVGNNTVEVAVSDGHSTVTITFAWDVKFMELFLPIIRNE